MTTRRSGANLVNLEAVGKAFGTRTLLDGVSLGIAAGERIGVVGRNGGGKSTLLRVLAGREPVDAGRVTHVGGLELGLLSQGDDLPPDATVRHVVVGDRADHEFSGDARIRDVVAGLLGGLEATALPDGLDSVVSTLSGGERRRVALAALLTGEHDLLVLDEPTNHLDVEGVAWLAGHLSARRGALVVVTHDRWFLDAVVDHTWEVDSGAVHEYEGGYAAYVLARAERERVAAGDAARRANLLRKELAWLRRGPPARTSKPRFRIDAANALIADEPEPRDRVALLSFASSRLGRTVFDLHDVTLSAGGTVLLSHLDWAVGPGDRIGLVGVNGAGKTTLLRALTGAHAPDTGRVVVGSTVRVGYLSQHVRELDPTLRVLQAVEEVRRVVELGGGRTMTASQLCERFGFTGDGQWTQVGELSGGERRRLQLLRLLMDEPNVLLLDEPTNDLDIETLTSLEDLLDGWPGSLVVVSHDRYFLERTTDRTLALLGDGALRDLPGGVEEYLARRRAMPAGAQQAASGRPARSEPPPARTTPAAATDSPAAAATSAASSPAQVRAARKDLGRVERRLSRLAAEEAELHARLAEHSTDYARVSQLDNALTALLAERAALEEEWLTLAEVAE